MARSVRVVVALGAAAATLLSTVPAATGATVAATTEGRVTRVHDGDTVDVDIYGDGTSTPVTIRNSGIQTMEVSSCHASQATAAMTSATLGKVVRLTSEDPRASSLGRLVRFVDVVDGSTVRDTQLAQLQAGNAVWQTLSGEDSRGYEYHLAMEQAAARGVGLFDDDFCGAGPSAGANLKIWVNYDGDGNEGDDVNTEWVQVLNQGTTTVPLGGWWIRSAASDTFALPSYARLAPGASLQLRVGRGRNSVGTMHWGWTAPRFENITPGNRDLGASAFLFDPQGDVRAHVSYPCVLNCTNPFAGRVTIAANPDAAGDEASNVNGEYVDLVSTSSTAVDLSYQVVQVSGFTVQLPRGTVLPQRGSALRVRAGVGAPTATTVYWGHATPIMTNSGGTATLRTTEAVTIACTAWGTGRC